MITAGTHPTTSRVGLTPDAQYDEERQRKLDALSDAEMAAHTARWNTLFSPSPIKKEDHATHLHRLI